MTKPRKITGTDWQGNTCHLVHIHNGHTVTEGETVADFRNEPLTIIGGRPPQKPGSTGRIWADNGSNYFPNVCGLEWRS